MVLFTSGVLVMMCRKFNGFFCFDEGLAAFIFDESGVKMVCLFNLVF